MAIPTVDIEAKRANVLPALVGVVVLVVGAGMVLSRASSNDAVDIDARGASDPPPVAAPDPNDFRPADAGAYYTTDGSTPMKAPPTRLAVGFVALDAPLDHPLSEFGVPDTVSPDIFGPAHRWNLPGDASFVAATWQDDDAIYGVLAEAPESGSTRIAMFGDVVLGASTLEDVVAAWGTDNLLATHPTDDYLVQYVACVGPRPVVVKFDHSGDKQGLLPIDEASPAWGIAITRVLVAYADEPPGSAGCE